LALELENAAREMQVVGRDSEMREAPRVLTADRCWCMWLAAMLLLLEEVLEGIGGTAARHCTAARWDCNENTAAARLVGAVTRRTLADDGGDDLEAADAAEVGGACCAMPKHPFAGTVGAPMPRSSDLLLLAPSFLAT